jgi:hypothetical protein
MEVRGARVRRGTEAILALGEVCDTDLQSCRFIDTCAYIWGNREALRKFWLFFPAKFQLSDQMWLWNHTYGVPALL